MTTVNFKKIFGETILNTKVIVEVNNLYRYNMFNTVTSMWMDSEFVCHFDTIRPEWAASEVTE